MRESSCTTAAAALLLTSMILPARAWTSIAGVASTASPGLLLQRPQLAIRHHHQNGPCVIHPLQRRRSYTLTYTRPRTRRYATTCSLERLPHRTLARVVPVRSKMERRIDCSSQTSNNGRRRLIDTLSIGFVGYWIAFFASRTVLGALAWRASCLMIFLQTVVKPIVELWGAGGALLTSKTRGALFTGRVTRTEFAPSLDAPNQWSQFRMVVEDEEGRELFFDVPQVPQYRDVRRGMRCEVIVLSRSAAFSELTGITEAYLPDLELFVGRNPLLDKRVFWDLLRARNERDGRRRDGNVDLLEDTKGVAPMRRVRV